MPAFLLLPVSFQVLVVSSFPLLSFLFFCFFCILLLLWKVVFVSGIRRSGSLQHVTVLADPPWCLIPSLTSLTATMVSSLKLLRSSIWEWDCEIHTSSYCSYTLYRVQFLPVVLTQRAEALSTNTLTREIYKLKKYRKYRTFFGKYRNLQDRPKNKEIQDTLGGLGTCLRLLFKGWITMFHDISSV